MQNIRHLEWGPLSLLCTVLLSVWLVISALSQLPGCRKVFSKFLPMHWVPAWNFFAPSPGVGDYQVYFRKMTRDFIDDWILVDETRCAGDLCFFWNPYLYSNKIICDTVRLLVIAKRIGFAEYSSACSMIRRAVQSQFKDCTGQMVQFIVVEIDANTNRKRVLFLSEGFEV